MNIAVLHVDGFPTCFGSAASAFENIEYNSLYSLCLKGEFQRHFEGFYLVCFTDLSRTTNVRSVATKHKV